MMNKRQPTIDEMIATERREASIALRHLSGESIDSEPLYFRAADGRSILTYHGALNVAQLLSIKRTSHTIRESTQRNGQPLASKILGLIESQCSSGFVRL